MFAILTFAALAAATPIADIGAQFAAETSTDHVACSAQEPERIVCFGSTPTATSWPEPT